MWHNHRPLPKPSSSEDCSANTKNDSTSKIFFITWNVLAVCFDYESVHSYNNRLAQSLSDSPVILISEKNYVPRLHTQPTFSVKINSEQINLSDLLKILCPVHFIWFPLFEQTLMAIKASEGLQFNIHYICYILRVPALEFDACTKWTQCIVGKIFFLKRKK